MNQEIAIVGLAGRFPGAKNADEFWTNLRDGVEAVTFFSEEELLEEGFDPNLIRDPHYVKAGAVLDGIELFDAEFFGYTPREAEVMDPQHRLFLEGAWEALENAGYDAPNYQGLISVFAAAGMNRYLLSHLAPNRELVEAMGEHALMIGNDKDFLATRVAYKLNLRGAAVGIQTACSSSLVAIHMACQSLLNFESDMALAGGTTVAVPQKSGYLHQEGGIASPDGHTRTFDANGAGTVFGSGVGIVVLKRLDDALEDGDHIYAVIKGSAINNDGSRKVSYTAPSIEGQTAVISEAMAVCDVEPDSVTYVEAHGTATPLGDPIEIAALQQAYRAGTDKTGYCAIGSVKSNVGHLDMAAGVTGVIKTALSLHHRQVPPSLHFAKANGQIDFSNSPFYVNTRLQEWKSDNGLPLRAGVSSFGFGGTNAHMVLEEAPERETGVEPSRDWHLLVLSARTESALEAATANLAAHVKNSPDTALADVAYTLQVGRRAFPHRRIVVCQTHEAASEALESLVPNQVFTGAHDGRSRSVAFLFSGTGSQYVNMARDLYETEGEFREVADECFDILKKRLQMNLRTLLFPKQGDEDASAKALNRTMYAQPALFVIEYAMGRLLMSWGIEPERMIGHSLGEYTAACFAGVLTLEDALVVVAKRARLIQALPSGAMLAVDLEQQEVERWLSASVALAAANSPKQCVLSGTEPAMEKLEQELTENGVTCQRVHTSHAFHSPMMDPILGEFLSVMQSIRLQKPEIPYVSNVTGRWITPQEATDPKYWVEHLRQTVRFAQGLQELCHDSDAVLVEIGPGKTLSSFAKQQAWEKREVPVVLPSIRHPREQQSDVAVLLNTVGRLWLNGVAVDWAQMYQAEPRLRVPLPTYPFERRRFWVEAPKDLTERAAQANRAVPRPPATRKPDEWFYAPIWKQTLPPSRIRDAEQSSWLLFADEGEASKKLLEHLQNHGQELTVVRAGESFLQVNQNEYLIQPEQVGDYKELFRRMSETGRVPQNLVHLWNLTSADVAGPHDLSRAERFQQAQRVGFDSLLGLAKALPEQRDVHAFRLYVLGDHLHEIESTDTLLPEKTPLLGLCKVIAQELPHVDCRVLDAPCSRENWAATVCAEMMQNAEDSENGVDRIAAYRGDRRWVPSYLKIPSQDRSQRPDRLRQGGVYLIAGAFGKIGSHTASYLARQAQARLVLVSRTEPQKQNRQQIQALEALGAQVLVLQADVTSANQLREAITAAKKRFGALHGIVHAAGGAGEERVSDIISIGQAEREANFSTKVQGLYALEEAVQGEELDFSFVVSSLASVLGGFGCAAYAAAHSFVDAFVVQQNRLSGSNWLSVNWDVYRDEDADEVLDRAFSQDVTGPFVMSRDDLHASIRRWLTEASRQLLEVETSTSQRDSHDRPNLPNAYVAPTNETEEVIADMWQRLLGIEQVGITDSFFELGGNSLLGMRMLARLRTEFEVDLPLQALFDATTVAELAVAVEEALIADILMITGEDS